MKYVIVFLLVFCCNAVLVADPGTAILAGNTAFSQARYDAAVVQYRAAIREGATWDWLPEMIAAAEARKALGKLEPVYTHRIALIFIASINEDGVRRPDVTDEQKRRWRMYAELLRELIETYSDGTWSARFDEVEARSTLAKADGLAPSNPDVLDLGEYFFESTDNIDTYITISNSVSPAYGLARTYPFVNGVLYGPPRGMVQINAGNHGIDVLFHEFFHAIEWVSGGIGGPAHGYRDDVRNSFPGWTGKGELNYYRWHFTNTLGPMGWKKLNHTTRWKRVGVPDKSAYDKVAAAYAKVPLKDRRTAANLIDEGEKLRGKDPMGAFDRYSKALVLSPFHPQALIRIAQRLRDEEKNEADAQPYLQRLSALRQLTDFYAASPEVEELGTAIGSWRPEHLSFSFRTIEWLVPPLPAVAAYEISLSYFEGWNAIDIEWVALLADGIEVARDSHVGMSGEKKANITYLMAPEKPLGSAKLTLVARVRGRSGTDSHGVVLVRAVTETH